MRKVVITGMGSVSPYGVGLKTLMENVYASKSAVKNMHREWKDNISDLNTWVGAPVQQIIDEKDIPRKYRRSMGPVALMAVTSSQEAVNNAKLTDTIFQSGKMGISYSSTMGSALWMEKLLQESCTKKSISEMPSSIFFKIMSHTCAANIAHVFNIKGRAISPDAACASSAIAVGLGFEAIKYGMQDIMLCGGADELHPVVSALFDLVGAASRKYNDEPTKTPRPFDKDRDGTVCADGAGTIILESEESALNRGAEIYAEVLGFSTLSDGEHLAEPRTESIKQCIKNALDNAGISSGSIDYINAHATGTILGDSAESASIKEVFGEQKVPVSSFKGYFGHTLGASGVLELIIGINMMKDGCLIPTHNLSEPCGDCSCIKHIMTLTKQPINILMKNSFAFGGINAVLILKRYSND